MSLTPQERDFLEHKAFNIRKHIVETVVTNGEGHAASSLSCSDIMSAIYFKYINVDVNNPSNKTSDKFIMSAGHKCLAVYGTLVEKGFEPESILKTYNNLHTAVPAHPDMKKFKGVDFSSGSLGHGISLAAGFALAAKMLKADYKTYVIMGDGEQCEGSVWEAASFAAHKKLDNLISFIDRNGLQINGTTAQVHSTSPLEARYASFGWNVITIDGHNMDQICEAIDAAHATKGKPTVIIANTIKGKGMSFMENKVEYHHWHPNSDEAQKALYELKETEKRWTA
jgi:transketolase